MKTKNKILSAALAVALSTAFLYATGPAGCGGSGGGTGAPAGDTSLTVPQQQQVLSVIESSQAASAALSSALGHATPGSLILDGSVEDITSTYSCDSGSITFDSSTSSLFTFTANACVIYDGATSNPDTNVTLNGGMSFASTGNISTITYNSLSAATGSHSCILGGNIVSTRTSVSPLSISEVFHLNGNCDSQNYTETGTLVLSQTGSDLFLNGSVTFSLTGISHSCTYSNLNISTATCATFAAACGFTESQVCH